MAAAEYSTRVNGGEGMRAKGGSTSHDFGRHKSRIFLRFPGNSPFLLLAETDGSGAGASRLLPPAFFVIPYRGFGPGNAGLGFVRGLGFGTQAPGNVAIGWMDLGDARRPLISFYFFLYQSVISTYYYLL